MNFEKNDVDSCILIDWFSFTCHIDEFYSVDQFDPVNYCIKLLGLDDCDIDWLQTYGANFYSNRIAFDGININFNPIKSGLGVFVELSGQGCRRFEESSSKTFIDLFNDINSCDWFNVTRLDLAFDDRLDKGILDINKIIADIHDLNFVSKFHQDSFIIEEHAQHQGQTVYIGSSKSDTRFRIYDKKYQLSRDDMQHWVRFEIQLRHDRAGTLVKHFTDPDFSVGSAFYGIINNYIGFVSPSDNDSNKRRWSSRRYWSKFLKSVEAISIYTPKHTDYNLARTEQYIHVQASNSIEALINKKGVYTFLRDMVSDKPLYNEKYEQISHNTGQILKFLEEAEKRGLTDVI